MPLKLLAQEMKDWGVRSNGESRDGVARVRVQECPLVCYIFLKPHKSRENLFKIFLKLIIFLNPPILHNLTKVVLI